MTGTPERLLLLTATITPSADAHRLVRADPVLRHADYRNAIAWYAGHLDPEHWQLMLVENSGSDLDGLVEAARTGGHGLRTLDVPPPRGGVVGKGNGEALMLDAALEHITRSGEQYEQVVKVTGRLLVRNLDSVLSRTAGPHVSARMHRDRSMADTRVLAFDPVTWGAHLSGLSTLVDEQRGRYLEHAVALRIAEAVYGSTRWIPFRREPDLVGVSGTDGIRYDSPRSRVTRHLKDALRLVPSAEYR